MKPSLHQRSPAGVLLAAAGAVAVLCTVLWALSPAAPVLAQSSPSATPPAQQAGATRYTVQMGDSWTSVSARTGLSIADLQRANPNAVRPSGWLIVGETLSIPGAAPGAAQTPAVGTVAGVPRPGTTQKYIVQAGESWNSIAQKFGITPEVLRAANPSSVRTGLVLFRGEEIVIPSPASAPSIPAAATPTPAATAAAATPTALPSQTPTTAATAAVTEAATEPATEAATEAATETATEAAATVAAAPATALPEPTTATTATLSLDANGCPSEFAAYPQALTERINGAGGMQAVIDLLRKCQALDAKNNVLQADWNGDGKRDLAVVIANPKSDASQPETDLLIFMSAGDRTVLSFRAKAAGQVKILAVEDINQDGKPDVAWVDTTCGASTCFDTVNVRSWDGSQWADWTGDTITMAYADIKLIDTRSTAKGKEIQLKGGVYGSVGAGPQRSRTEVWGSVDGAPYELVDKVYDRSNCLYHKVLDANEALQRAKEIGWVQAKEMYTEAITNKNLAKCWQHDNELNELRSFSLFRLALIDAYQGSAQAAGEAIGQLVQAYPGSIYTKLGQAWLTSYQATNSIAKACAAATDFAKANPDSYKSLSDYGYANPTFQPEDLCPILDVPAQAAPAAGATAALTATVAVTVTGAVTPTESVAITATGVTTTQIAAPAAAGQEGQLPDCPKSLDLYATVLPQVMKVAGGDPLVIETWLRVCKAMDDDRGGMVIDDFNGDGIKDALFLPTIVSDLGFGPKGAQGAVLIYHGSADGGYALVYSPEIYGQPVLLNKGDVNGDGKIDLAWTVEGCSTFCVKEVQIVTWDPQAKEYASIIEPGATIAQGKARFEDLPAGAPGKGKQLVLEGGVSGTAEGGLAVLHAETWQSIGGGKFRRLSWSYDRKAQGNDCLGLRLVEADIALQASDVLGYAPAADLYRAAMDPKLRACSIFGVPGDQELKLLQGLLSFRLAETLALSGTVDAAQQVVDGLKQGQPDTAYTKAATTWLSEYQKAQDAKAACKAVQPIFDKTTETWQITDHFGFNHPALAAEQICFVPRQE